MNPGPLTRDSFEMELERYGARLARRSRRLLLRGLRKPSAPRHVAQMISAAGRRRRLVSTFRRLSTDHIRELL